MLRAASKALGDARSALNGQVAARVDAKGKRDTAEQTLRDRMSGLVEELGQANMLADDDDRWYAFGLVPPAGVERPSIAPEDLTLRRIAPGTVASGWSRPPRAQRYRVFAKVEGRDADFVQVAVTHDPDYTFENLPTTGKLSAYLIATNPAGDSPASETVEISLS